MMDVFRIGVGGVPGVVHLAVAVGGHVFVAGVRRTTMTRLLAGRPLVAVAVLGVAVIARPLAAVAGVLTAALWRFVVAVRVVRRPGAVRAFVALRGVDAGAVVGLRLMGRFALLTVPMAVLRCGMGGVVTSVVVWSVPLVSVLVTGVGVAW
ncbi:hypothetical protein [Micromonospora sp. DT227]|uniref:hypothetical protein n=1 Tax=Micromonospora sp. DT227 TaxID=3393433 RepID=UPI003CEB389F